MRLGTWLRVAGIALLGGVLLAPAPVRAACSSCGDIASSNYFDMMSFLDGEWYSNKLQGGFYQNHVVSDFYNNLLVVDFWENQVRPALQDMTAQFTAAGTQMTGLEGRFIDGAQQLETQRLLQKLQAQAVKDYTPGENLCRFGTGVRSLAGAETRALTTAIALNEINQDRMLGTKGGSADIGRDADRHHRLDQFQRLYCDPADNNGQLKSLCFSDTSGGGSAAPTSKPERFNKDIDYTRTVSARGTLDLNYADGALTPDEEDVLALSANLYGHDVFERLTAQVLKNNPDRLMDLRQIAALRSVAQNSFNSITALRSSGPVGSSLFLKNVLKEMGMSADETDRYLGVKSGTGEPSYYAQMEILTKKLYQNPDFYASLMDKPANVDRQQAAMQAFGLMQDRDLYASVSRSEMLLSLLLELKIRNAQREVERQLPHMAGSGVRGE